MENLNLNKHISQQFNEELESIRNQVLQMGGLVEKQLADALQALFEGNGEIGEEVVRNDYKVNHMEVEIDEACSRILARRQPAASDLRVVVAIIKTITDLERMGDEADKIGRMAIRLAQHERPRTQFSEIEPLGQRAKEMLHSALDAFARMDTELALQVVRNDRLVDQAYEGAIRQLVTFMMEDPRTISRSLDVMWSARALERIGDHARNICEYVIYFVEGKDVRHVTPEQAEAAIQAGSE